MVYITVSLDATTIGLLVMLMIYTKRAFANNNYPQAKISPTWVIKV